LTTNEVGLFFGTNEPGTVPLNLTVSHNSFNNNVRQLGGCLCQGQSNASEAIHTWDDGKEGNYWSDYNGSDLNKDGIGDTPYVFDVQNEDRYPLMTSPVAPPNAAFPSFVVVEILVLVAVAIAVAVSFGVWRVKRKKKEG
jgi:nitrous oxidase accessory protein NosD